MAFPGADADAPALASRVQAPLLRAYRQLAAAVERYPLERIGLAAVAAGVVFRLFAPFFMDFRADGDTYTAMGHAWALHGKFLMPYGDVSTWEPLPPGYSNHYPPAYPFYLGVVFKLFGFGLWQAKWAAVVVSLAALAAVYWTSKDLYGRVPAALATGLMALEPHLLWSTGTGFSENMVLLFFALTMWAILRSLENDRMILLAGLFAALAYLSRASVGYFFVIAGFGGLAWRLYYRGWRVLKNPWYLGAIGIFGSIVVAWAVRNALLFPPIVETVTLFGSTFTLTIPAWETSSYTRYVQAYAFGRLDQWGHALIRKIPFFAAFLLWYTLPLLPESWRATKRVREEHTSALWLSVALVWIIAWAISSMFWVFEQSSLYWFDNHRYVVIGLLPLAWLLLREARLDRASTRLRVGLLAVSLFAACGAVFTDPIQYADLRAAEFMDPYLREGDEVGVDGGTIKYAFYPYLTRPETIQVYGCEAAPERGDPRTGPCHGAADWQGKQAEFILTLKGGARYAGYEKVGTFRQHYSDGGMMTAVLWAREDVVQERGVPTGVVRDH